MYEGNFRLCNWLCMVHIHKNSIRSVLKTFLSSHISIHDAFFSLHLKKTFFFLERACLVDNREQHHPNTSLKTAEHAYADMYSGIANCQHARKTVYWRSQCTIFLACHLLLAPVNICARTRFLNGKLQSRCGLNFFWERKYVNGGTIILPEVTKEA